MHSPICTSVGFSKRNLFNSRPNAFAHPLETHTDYWHTFLNERKLHLISPFALVPLGHWPWLMVLMILSIGLGSNMQKTPSKNSSWFSHNFKVFQFLLFYADHETTQISLQSIQILYPFQILCFYRKWVYVRGTWDHILFLYVRGTSYHILFL